MTRRCNVCTVCKHNAAVWTAYERPWRFEPLDAKARLVVCHECRVEIEKRVKRHESD